MSEPEDNIAAAILAGGQAVRFAGRAKGLLRLPDGTTLVQRTLAGITAAGLAKTAIFAARIESYRYLGVPVLPDLRAGIGPLAGVEAALHHFRSRCAGVLVLPCDLPAITTHEIQRLVSAFAETDAPAVVAETAGGFWHPLCAVVRADLADSLTRRIDQGARSAYRLWQALGVRPVRFPDPLPFFNVNTPEDWAEWLSRGRRSVALER